MTKLILLIPDNSLFYRHLFHAVKAGFEEIGCTVIDGRGDLPLQVLIDHHRPDFVFEMNRTKSEYEDYPSEIPHICWLVDFWGRTPDTLGESDILYTFSNGWVRLFDTTKAKKIAYFPPATDPKIFYPSPGPKKSDFIFMGHIPSPWSTEELERPVGLNNQEGFVKFKDLLPIIQEFAATRYTETSLLDRLGKVFNCDFNDLKNSALMYDISSRAMRQARRETFLNHCLTLSDSLIIYGTQNWQQYPLFQDKYIRFVEKPTELNQVIQEAHILLHDGNYPHFRTFDAMAAGTVVAAAAPSVRSDTPMDDWETLGFEKNIDYIEVDFYASDTTLGRLLSDKKFLADVAYNGREKILSGHTWAHRASRVINDLKEIKGERIRS